MRQFFLPFAILLVFVFLVGPDSIAQTNNRGTVHISMGGSLGVLSTKFDQEFNLNGQTERLSTKDDAMSHTIPLDFQFGVAKQLSVGLYFEYGNYKDFEYGSYIDTFTYVGSNDTLTSGRFLDTLASNSKRLYHVGLAPRFYIMNKYRFNWMIGPEFGISAVQFNDFAVDFNNKKFSDVYVGIHFRLATGVSYYFGNHFGLQAQVRYGMSSMKWRDRDPENSVFDSLDYQSKLTATGFQFGLGLTVRMGK